MRYELGEQLIREFPELFGESFFFECGDGWFDLLRILCSDLMPLLPAANADHEAAWGADFGKIRVDQIKEKFGRLRFYMSWTPEDIARVISHYEGLSEKTCEVCGQSGTLDMKRQLVTCDGHGG